MQNLTITISSEQATRIHRAVETGAYASQEDVLKDALLLWEQQEELRMLDMAVLKKAYDEGKASGEGRIINPQDLLSKFKAKALARG